MFKKLHILPEVVRNEKKDGYCYPEEYIGNTYEYKDQYVFFTKTSYELLNKGFLEVVIDGKIKEQLKTALDSNNNIETLNARLDEIVEKMTNKTNTEELIEVQNHLETNIIKLKEQFEKQIIQIKKENEERILKELQIVYDSVQKTVEEAVAKKEPIKATKTLNLGILFALKEAGYSPKEIGELKKESLI